MGIKSDKVLFGIGNNLRGDDGAGSFIARNFSQPDWITIDGKSAPENYTSVIKKLKPNLLIMIDSANMSLPGGIFRLIPLNKITHFQLSTHSMPLPLLIKYLTPYCKKIMLIGIQPINAKLGEPLSKPVLDGCHKIIKKIKENKINDIPII